MRALIAAGLVAAALLGACGGDDGDVDAGGSATAVTRATTTTAAPSTTAPAPSTAAPTTATTAPPVTTTSNPDWDKRKYDLGVIARYDEERGAIDFDRMTREGVPDSRYFQDPEPRFGPDSDYPFHNENTRLRRFFLAPGAELLRGQLESPDGCEAGEGRVRYRSAELSELHALQRTPQHDPIVVMSYDRSGRITRIREYVSC